MSTAQTTSERDPGRWMALYSVIVAVLATVLDGALMGREEIPGADCVSI